MSFEQILHRAKKFYPPHCTYCQQHEHGMNIALDRLTADYAQGIGIRSRPYYSRKDVVVIGMGRWGKDYICSFK